MLGAYASWYQREADAGMPGADQLLAQGRLLAHETPAALERVRLSALADGFAINEWLHGRAGRALPELQALHDALVRLIGWRVAHGWMPRWRDPPPCIAAPVAPSSAGC